MHIWWKNADFQRVSYIVSGFIMLACFTVRTHIRSPYHACIFELVFQKPGMKKPCLPV